MHDQHNHPIVKKNIISKRQYLFLLAIIAIILFIDQITKYIISTKMQLNQSIQVTPFLSLTYITNTGVSFGSFQGYNLLFIIITTLFILFIIYYLPYFETKILPAIALVLAGAIGNLIDRILYSHVIDFIDFKIWPVFNIADSSITIAAVWIIIVIFFKKEKDQETANLHTHSQIKE